MPIQKLAKAGAFGIGSELWIIPEPEVSSWSRRIDWYLNFQVARSQLTTATSLSPEIKAILEDNEIDWHMNPLEKPPLMVMTLGKIPALQVVCLSYHATGVKWFDVAHKIWLDLNRPRVRLFLPPELEEKQLLNSWTEDRNNIDLTFIPGDLSIEA
ncbi:MAG: hypothetical protein KDD22_03000 [Bdellovibrionales bacterium]|nr:hypothetical protein [Bdellovibrionales bacterium]